MESDSTQGSAPLEPPAPEAFGASPTGAERAVAAAEVVLCSDYPTQIALAATFSLFGFRPLGPDGLSLAYVVVLSLADTAFLVALMLFFLQVHGESPRDLFLGGKDIRTEAWAGIPLLFGALAIALVVLLGIQAAAPWLRTQPRNPLQDLVRTPGDAAMFAVVLIVAGGIREELQRAFLLGRFERWLGGRKVGLVVSSVMFGAGHLVQGADAAIATGVLGAFWGLVYLRRRSVVAPVVSHAGFNLVQVLQFLSLAR